MVLTGSLLKEQEQSSWLLLFLLFTSNAVIKLQDSRVIMWSILGKGNMYYFLVNKTF